MAKKPKQRTNAYWRERAELRERQSMASAEEVERLLFEEYRRSEEAIIQQAESFYAKYMQKYGVSYAEAVKQLKANERTTWLIELQERLAEIEAGINVEENYRIIEAQSYGKRISRLQARFAEIDLEIVKLGLANSKALNAGFESIIQEAYLRSVYDIQVGTGIGVEISQLSPELIRQIMEYPWSGASYSTRLWRNMDALRFKLRETLTQGIIQGKNIEQMTSEIKKNFDVSRSAARRIIRTETNYIHNQARLESFKALGAKKYRFIATLDDRTSEMCQEHDLQEFDIEDAEVGINFPPLHPHCRSTVVAVIEGLSYIGKRAAKDENGKTYYVPADMSYKEWRETMVRAA